MSAGWRCCLPSSSGRRGSCSITASRRATCVPGAVFTVLGLVDPAADLRAAVHPLAELVLDDLRCVRDHHRDLLLDHPDRHRADPRRSPLTGPRAAARPPRGPRRGSVLSDSHRPARTADGAVPPKAGQRAERGNCHRLHDGGDRPRERSADEGARPSRVPERLHRDVVGDPDRDDRRLRGRHAQGDRRADRRRLLSCSKGSPSSRSSPPRSPRRSSPAPPNSTTSPQPTPTRNEMRRSIRASPRSSDRVAE